MACARRGGGRIIASDMDAAGLPALQAAIRAAHGVNATWLRTEHVKQVFGDALMWEGEVQVFGLEEHPHATIAFAWSHELIATHRRKVITVLGIPPVDTALAAVRAMLAGGSTSVTLPSVAAVRVEPPPDDGD